jgi:hypothetical protein
MRHINKSGKVQANLISASEIACFAYCPEQWRLQYGLKLAPGNRAVIDAGTRHHRLKAVAERVAAGLIGLGGILAVIALLVLFLRLVVFR